MTSHLLSLASGGALVDLDGTFFIQLGLFFLMFIFLYAALFRPAVRMIDARRAATVGAVEQARVELGEAEVLMSDVDSQILDIRVSAAAERDRMIDQARRTERDLMIKVREDSRKIAEEARVSMEKKGAMVKRELEKEVQSLADAVAIRILDRNRNV